jgi:hypothetical protein
LIQATFPRGEIVVDRNRTNDFRGRHVSEPERRVWPARATILSLPVLLRACRWDPLVRLDDLGPEGSSSSGTPPTVAQYAYDGRNFRVVKKTYVSGQLDETRHYYYNNQWQCLEERLDDETRGVLQYVWGLRYIDDLVLCDRDADLTSGTGSLGHSGSGQEERLYALTDRNFNVVALADAAGDVVERYRYDVSTTSESAVSCGLKDRGRESNGS